MPRAGDRYILVYGSIPGWPVVAIVYLEPGAKWQNSMQALSRLMTFLNGGKRDPHAWNVGPAPGGEKCADDAAAKAEQKKFFETGKTGERFIIAPDGAISQVVRTQ